MNTPGFCIRVCEGVAEEKRMQTQRRAQLGDAEFANGVSACLFTLAANA